MSNDEQLEARARAMFEAEPGSQFEADWDHLAEYKRYAWICMAHTAAMREPFEP